MLERLRQPFKLLPVITLALPGWLLVAGSALGTSTSVLDRLGQSVGTVVDGSGASSPLGSAVTVAPKVMVTRRSVVANVDRFVVVLGGRYLDASLGACDTAHDLCLLDVPRLDAEPVEFGFPEDHQVGDRIILAASSDTLGTNAKPAGKVAYSEGMITARRAQDDAVILDHTAPATSTAQGGGVFDPSGKLLGVDGLDSRGGMQRQYVIPVLWVRNLGVFGAGISSTSNRPRAAITNNLEVSPQLELVKDANPARPVLTAPSGPSLPALPSLHLSTGWMIGGGATVLALILLLRLFRRAEPEHAHRTPMAHNPMPAAIAKAEQELAQGHVEQALWELVKQAEPHDGTKARHLYIQRRARNIIAEQANHRLRRTSQ